MGAKATLGAIAVGAAALVAGGCGGSAATVQDDPPWHLDRVSQRELPLDGEYEYFHTGAGVRVYVVDDGIRPHPDLAHLVAEEARYSPHGDTPTGDHGTRAAGAVGGTEHGVAKDVTLIDVHAYDDAGNDREHNQLTLDAYDWILANHPRGAPGVVYNAWGQAFPGDAEADDLTAKYRELMDAGLVCVVSAGNGGVEVGEDPDAVHPHDDGNPDLIYVGATNEGDEPWEHSNWGARVDIWAPGEGLTLPSGEDEVAEGTSGTSWAAPIVAGVAALVLEQNPGLSPQQVKDALVEQSTQGVLTGMEASSHNRLLYGQVVAPSGP